MHDDEGLRDFWTLTSITNSTSSGAPKSFVATIEAKKYPFMATQFHPEKSTQAWNDPKYNMNHSWMAQKLNRMFAD